MTEKLHIIIITLIDAPNESLLHLYLFIYLYSVISLIHTTYTIIVMF